MRNLVVFLALIMLAGCVPEKPPVQNEFLLNLERTPDFHLALSGEETVIADGVRFLLEKSEMAYTIPNIDKDSPFDTLYSKLGGFLVCQAQVWKENPGAVFPKFDMISVIPSFGTLTQDQSIIKHAELAYGKQFFSQDKVGAEKKSFVFVYEINMEQLGWSFNFYKNIDGKLKLFRIVETER